MKVSATDAVGKWMDGNCELGGLKVHYRRSGAGRPSIVLLHGLTGSSACWMPFARCLRDGFDIVMPDSRGHGQSGAPLHGYRYEDLAVDVERLIASLRLAEPVLLGHLMGGMTAALVAARARARLRGLVLLDPPFLSPARQREVRDSEIDDRHRIALMMSKSELVGIARERHPTRSLEMIELQAEARLRTRLAAFDVLTPPIPSYEELVRSFDVPCMLVIGDREPVVSPQVARNLQSLNPRLRVEQIKGAGQAIPYDQPEKLAQVLIPFLQELTRVH